MDSVVLKQKHSKVILEINKCSNATREEGHPICATPEEIREWTERKTARLRIINQKIDFNDFSAQPFRQFEVFLPNIPLAEKHFTDSGYRYRRNIF